MKITRLMAAVTLCAGVAVPLGAGVAHAADDPCYTSCPPPHVKPHDLNRDPPKVLPLDKSRSLPFTGTDVIELSLIGVGAVGVGTVMVRRSRRSSSAA